MEKLIAKSKAARASFSCGMQTLDTREYFCPVELTLQVIGSKCNSVILYPLGRRGTMRFSKIR